MYIAIVHRHVTCALWFFNPFNIQNCRCKLLAQNSNLIGWVQQLLHGGVPINSTSYNTIVRINDNLTTATTSYNQIASLGNHYNPTNSNSMGTSNDISLLLPPALLDAQTQTRLVVDSSSDYNINITNTSIKYNHSNDINYMGSKYIHNNTELQGVPTPNHHHHHNSNEMHSLLQMLGYIKYWAPDIAQIYNCLMIICNSS